MMCTLPMRGERITVYTRVTMRTIILVQSIIIVLGAYYIYTLSAAAPVVQTPVPAVEIVPVSTTTEVRTGYSGPTTQPPEPTALPDTFISTSSVTGPNDAGMEYPTMQ